MRLRIGELLVKHGLLTLSQCEHILYLQRESQRPFGAIAEEQFNVPPNALHEAWAEQYEQLAPRTNPTAEQVEPKALSLVSRRQAWQFRLLPLRFESGEVVICTTRQHLPRALNFAYRHLGPECSFVIAEPQHLGPALQQHYPWSGPVDAAIIGDLAAFAKP
ncbi:MAG: hypothetical protein ACKVS8_07965 [Phycisphaerales bacterium]